MPNFNLTGYPKVVQLSILYKSLRNITFENFKECRNLKSLTMFDVSLQEVKNGSFRDLTDLTSLVIVNGKVSSIEPNAFEGLVSLEMLLLSGNDISYLHPDTFGMLHKLFLLKLSSNAIKELAAGIFRNNRYLAYLDMDRNQLEKLPDNLFASETQLVQIQFENNKLVTARTYGAKSVRLDSNQLTSVQLESGTERVSINFNAVESLNCADADLSSIKFFFAMNNSLANFNCLREMENLNALWLQMNNFSGLTQKDFKKLTRLAVLILYGQNQTFGIETFEPLKNLQLLSLDGLVDYQNLKTQHLISLDSIVLTTETWNVTYKQDIENILRLQNIKLIHRKSYDFYD